MNTDFNRVTDYYSKFNEWERLDLPQGQLEYEILKDILSDKLSDEKSILDLGGGPGRYTFHLAKKGFQVFLGDISPNLIEQAKKRSEKLSNDIKENVKEIIVLNATDLSHYKNDLFDAVLLFGPLYHLNIQETKKCLQEVRRVLKRKGLLFSIYMPYEVGLKAMLERSFYAPGQVNAKILEKLVKTGQFKNNRDVGFQEGFFPKTQELIDIFVQNSFEINEIRSIRGIGYENEERIMKRKIEDLAYYNYTIKMINETASIKSIINTGGHALIIAKNNK